MKKVSISSVPIDAILAEPIISENGITLLGKGSKISQSYLCKLEMIGIDYVYIEETSANTERQMTKLSENRSKNAVYHMSSNPQLRRNPSIQDTFNKVLNDILSNKAVIRHLDAIYAADESLFHHSINTSALSLIVGTSLEYSHLQLIELGIGALLMDIGMTQCPKEIWNKKDTLTTEEMNVIKKHPLLGYQLLSSSDNIPEKSAQIVLQHHERYNGCGYPHMKKGNDIYELARIVAISDVYDALTSPRRHRNRYSPLEALEFIFGNGNSLFDLKLIKHFVKHIAIYPVGTTVLLSTNQIGIVKKVFPEAMYRPVIQIMREANGEFARPHYELDLRSNLSVVIKQEICTTLR